MSTSPEENTSALRNVLVTAGAIGIPAVLTYLLARRFRTKGPIPKNLAKLIRDRGMLREVPEQDIAKSRLGNLLRFGTSHVRSADAEKLKRTNQVVFSPFQDAGERVRTKHRLGVGRTIEDIVNKDYEARVLGRTGSNLFPTTLEAKNLPRRIRKIRDPKEKLTAIKKYLDKRFGKWIIKGVALTGIK